MRRLWGNQITQHAREQHKPFPDLWNTIFLRLRYLHVECVSKGGQQFYKPCKWSRTCFDFLKSRNVFEKNIVRPEGPYKTMKLIQKNDAIILLTFGRFLL